MLAATDAANAKKEVALEKSMEIEHQAKIISVEKRGAEEALAEAMPALEAARAALAELEKSDITEIRYGLDNPIRVKLIVKLGSFPGLLRLRRKPSRWFASVS